MYNREHHLSSSRGPSVKFFMLTSFDSSENATAHLMPPVAGLQYITMIVTSPFLNSPNRNFTFLHHLGKFNYDLAPPNPISPFYFSDSLSHASADSFLF
jgi:hypothetical protein